MAEVLMQDLELSDLDKLRLHPDNPRDGDVAAIGESIDTVGFFGALVVQRSTGFILVGNHRYLAAKDQGIGQLPVLYVDVDDEKARRILLADNRLSDIAGWDEAALGELLQELSLTDAGLIGTGFSESDLAALIGTGTDDPADEEVPDLPAEPISVTGDLWVLGEHRLLVGDATQPDDVARVMGGAMADMIFTDPPYNVAYDPEARVCHFSPERKANPLGEIAADKMSDADYVEFLRATFDSAYKLLRPGGAVYICHADTQGLPVRMAFAEFFRLASCVIWSKTVHAFGRADYHWKHEPILYGWRDGAAHTWYGDRTQNTIWEYASDHYTGEKYQHPTQKPVPLVKRALENSSPHAGLVLDPFGGSGTTIVAAERMGRRARLVEIDPRFADVICSRFQTLTGTKPVHEATSKPHDFSIEE